MAIIIREDNLSGQDVRDLLRTHLETMSAQSPPESVHALGLDELRKTDATVWSAWLDGLLVGTGALKELDHEHGEIKSMHTLKIARGRGIAEQMLLFIVDVGRARGYRRISLETGSMDVFAPARALYAKHGFLECGPFGGYTVDPNSVFLTRDPIDPVCQNGFQT